MPRDGALQAVVFGLVTAAFMTVYVTQPVLPILRAEFGVSAATASLTISAVVFGIALANLPFGALADVVAIRPIVAAGGFVVGAASIVCAFASSMRLLVAARFVQGLCVPALTTCIASYLGRALKPDRLNVVMGWYVSATVVGGLGGRLLAGFVFSEERWRYAFLVAAGVVLASVLAAWRALPDEAPPARGDDAQGFVALLLRPDLLRMFAIAFSGFFVFSAMFNYLPFYLSAPPLSTPVRIITLLYLAYLFGVVAGPLSGKLTSRFGTGTTLIFGSLLFAASVAATLVKSRLVIAASLAGICGGFFAIHSSAVGSLNRRLSSSRGRANSLYVLAYYLGGAAGISATGVAFAHRGWPGAVALGIATLSVPLAIGVFEARAVE